MLSIIDKKLFPEDITVIEALDGKSIYLIHKNASTTLQTIQKRVLSEAEVAKLELVDVFVRDPYTRFLSGVQTYATKTGIKNIPDLAKIINDVYFINNHFCPQLFWIINLQRFCSAKIRINHINTLEKFTKVNQNKQTDYSELDVYFKDNKQLKYYLELDCVLYENFINKTVTFTDIIATLKSNYNELYNDTFGFTKQICNVLD